MKEFIRTVILIVMFAIATPVIWILDRVRWKK